MQRNRRRLLAALLLCAAAGQTVPALPAAAAKRDDAPAICTETAEAPRFGDPESSGAPIETAPDAESPPAMPEEPEEAEDPSSSSPAPVTPPEDRPGAHTSPRGTGTVLENTADSAGGREFFTVECEGGGVYYLVVDREKLSNNVYFLKEVTEQDLAGLVKKTEKAEPEAPAPAPPKETGSSAPTLPAQSAPPQAWQKAGNGFVPLFFAAIAAAVVGGIAWFRRKRATDPGDDGAEDCADPARDDPDDRYDEDDAAPEPASAPPTPARDWTEEPDPDAFDGDSDVLL